MDTDRARDALEALLRLPRHLRSREADYYARLALSFLYPKMFDVKQTEKPTNGQGVAG